MGTLPMVITPGDPLGIGPEVVCHALKRRPYLAPLLARPPYSFRGQLRQSRMPEPLAYRLRQYDPRGTAARCGSRLSRPPASPAAGSRRCTARIQFVRLVPRGFWRLAPGTAGLSGRASPASRGHPQPSGAAALPLRLAVERFQPRYSARIRIYSGPQRINPRQGRQRQRVL